MSRIVSETEFRAALLTKLHGLSCDAVMGPGRSGAVAAVYASHMLGVPFLPCGTDLPAALPRLLIVDTAMQSGRTLRRMQKRYPSANTIAIYHEPPRVRFWYEVAA